ncbi:SRPBCC family protein [Saccharothrix australiensis]|uniref:Polyketide cyclase/dehydrase/lipid transport protein n=1 Tax=Saccharothrix australiensis TaxID=2072 RepID=A0A495VYQ9_9PSEU|nr:SRPBCC family protein [Saccharothrix australiensis]RKT53897.1 polyketide cyclase/dehydrase/lipid transport protein [Saccharothrix australiensis]
MDIDRNAPVIARHSTTIDASLADVWALHTDVKGWPAWQPEITSAVLDGPFEPGAVFRWRTHGLAITSTVAEADGHRTVWGGPAHGIDGVHVWTFEGDSPVVVTTEESWDGEPVRADVAAMRAALDASLAAWLRHLKAAAERA